MKEVKSITSLLSQGDFFQAREYFLSLLSKLRSKYPVEHQAYPIGQDDHLGRPLYIDSVLVGSRAATNLIIISSGTHGVEFYGGAAIQYLYLNQLIDGERELANNTQILLIHAVNPFGASWLSRFNEDNIDLNRNFRDHSITHLNSDYQKIAIAFEKPVIQWLFYPSFVFYLLLLLPGLLFSLIKSILTRNPSIFRNGKPFRYLQKTIQGGQYTNPNGIFYGGRTPSRSNHLMHQIMDNYALNAQKIYFLDLHTGLGKKGALDIIHGEFKLATNDSFEHCRRLFGDQISSSIRGTSTSEVLEGKLPTGCMDYILQKSSQQVPIGYALTLEFGTKPEILSLLALRNRNLESGQKGTQKIRGKYPRQVFDQFFCSDEQWIMIITQQALAVVDQIIKLDFNQ